MNVISSKPPLPHLFPKSLHNFYLARATTPMRLAINTESSDAIPDDAVGITNSSPNSTDQATAASLPSPSLQFGPIWVREAQRAAALPNTSQVKEEVTQPSTVGNGAGAIKEILCQPPTPEKHLDSLRHAFLSLPSSF